MKDVDEISVTDDDMLMLSASDEITRASEMLGDETLCYELILKDKAYFNDQPQGRTGSAREPRRKLDESRP